MGRKIYVGNLNAATTEAELKELFSAFGKVSSVKIKRDSVTGEPWGYGFVVMETQEAGETALDQANGQELHEQKIQTREMRTL